MSWRSSESRTENGQQLAEMMGGLLVLIPIVLFLLDMSVVVLSNQLADKYAKAAARAAANQTNSADARTAADNALKSFAKSGFVQDLTIKTCDYTAIDRDNPNDPTKGKVVVQLKMDVKLPVPIPFVPEANSSPTFVTQAVEPVVALPPP